MKKVLFLVIVMFFLNGCFQMIALVGPAANGVATGKVYQSAISYSLSYGVQKATGKTIIENVIDINKESKKKKKIAKKIDNIDKVLINSFYPRTYPQSLKSMLLN